LATLQRSSGEETERRRSRQRRDRLSGATVYSACLPPSRVAPSSRRQRRAPCPRS
jgi:hypothetical protein